jgi:hypothetical protein
VLGAADLVGVVVRVIAVALEWRTERVYVELAAGGRIGWITAMVERNSIFILPPSLRRVPPMAGCASRGRYSAVVTTAFHAKE